MGLPLLGLGLWHAVSTRRWVVGAGIAAVGVAWTALCIWVVIPAAAGSHSPFYHHFHEVGGSPGGLLETTLTDPSAVAGELLTAADVRYLILLGLPLLGVFLAAPLLVVAAVPAARGEHALRRAGDDLCARPLHRRRSAVPLCRDGGRSRAAGAPAHHGRELGARDESRARNRVRAMAFTRAAGG